MTRYFQKAILIVLTLVSLVFWVACSKQARTQLNVDAGYASYTLKEFAKQAGVEIIFDPQSVYGVKLMIVVVNFWCSI